MVFRRNTLKNTKTFKRSRFTSSGTSNINTLSTKQNIPTPQTTKHVSGSNNRSEEPKRQTYKTSSTKEWSLKSIFPEIVGNEAHAELDETSIPESPVTSPDFHDPSAANEIISYHHTSSDTVGKKPPPQKEDFNLFDTTTWFGPPTVYQGNPAAADDNPTAAEEDLAAVPSAVIPELEDEVKTDSYPKPDPMTKGPQAVGGATNKDGKWVSTSIPEGFTIGTTVDSVPVTKDKTFGNEYRTSLYNIPSHISPSAHQKALNTQAMYKFENHIQSSFSTMLRGSGPGNRLNQDNFLDLKSQINSSNISQSKKDDMISEYTNKITNYQKAAGGYGTSDPWSFGTVSSKNPNKAERLQNKLDSGKRLTEKERKYLAVVTGKNKVLQYDSIGMGQTPDYTGMFTPGVTAKVLKNKVKPIWHTYQDIGY